MSEAFDRAIAARFGDRVKRRAPLAPLTTFKVGGPADWLIEARAAGDIASAVALARRHGVPLTVLGGGSNVLVADAGVRGLVVRVHGGDVRALSDSQIRADAGVTINGLVRWTIAHGYAGLEAWAGTPGTVGGAIHGNAHFQGRLISEFVERVTLLTPDGLLADVPVSEMEFAYDDSRLHRTKELVVSADFRAVGGEPSRLRSVARDSLAFRKQTQPLESASAGCIFQNPVSGRDRVPDGMPYSAGALVDCAGLKGAAEGHAMVSRTHANFIVNCGGASASEIRALIERCKQHVKSRFGVELREEIVYLGFADSAGQGGIAPVARSSDGIVAD